MDQTLPEKSEFLTAPEVAQELRISLSKTYRLLRQRVIPVVRIVHQYRIRKTDLDKFISRNELEE